MIANMCMSNNRVLTMYENEGMNGEIDTVITTEISSERLCLTFSKLTEYNQTKDVWLHHNPTNRSLEHSPPKNEG